MAEATPASPAPEALAKLAARVAAEASNMILTRLDDVGSVDTKTSHLDLVTDVDRASEELIVARLTEACPYDGIVGEEGAQIDGTSGTEWVIDPIDGTTSFVFGLPCFSVSIAARHHAQPLAGVVHAPVIGSVYRGFSGGGVAHNGRSVTVSERTDLSTALVATGFSSDDSRRARQGSQLATIIRGIRDIRRSGSAALDLATVAAGQVDAYYELGLCDWDWAAGAMLVAEAGGRLLIERDDATGRAFVAAAAPGIADDFFDLLLTVGANSP